MISDDAEHTYVHFYDEVCRRAEENMLKSGKLEGMHFMAMKQVKAEWDKLFAGDNFAQ